MNSCSVWVTALAAVLPVLGQAQALSVPVPQNPPWASSAPSNTAEVSVLHQGTLIVGQAHFRMGSDGVFDRPIILVEGFDFGHGWQDDLHGYGTVTWHGIFGGDPSHVPAGLDYRPLLDELHDRGADVIFLDFEFGTASLQAKSALLRHVIGLTNAHRQGNQQGILVGVSMGGVVGRMALKSMEEDQLDHCIGQFYSIDAPHLGAVMPVGFQALVLGLSSMSEDGMQMWQALNSVAARQLLRHHIADGETFASTQSELHNMDWPTVPHKLAIINSQEQAWAELTSEPLLRVEWGVGAPFNSSLFYVHADRWSATQSQGGAAYLLPGDLNPWSDASIVQTGAYSFAQTTSDEESLPGSEATHLTQMVEAMNAQFAPLQVLHQTLQSDVTFVPYFSALAQEEMNEEPWIDRSEAQDGEPREDHASLAPHHRTFLLEWVDGLWTEPEMPDTISEQATSMTFGWTNPTSRTLPSVTLTDQGQIQIGNNAELFLTHMSSCQGHIEVVNQGALLIGGPDGSIGQLNVVQGATLMASHDGEIVVYPGSKLKLQAGAHLDLRDAALRILPGGLVSFEPGSRVTLSDGALIDLAPAAQLELSGDVILPQGSSALVASAGNASWNSGGNVSALSLSTLELEQSITGHCQINGEVGWHGAGKINVDGGSFELGPTSQLNVHAKLELESMSISTLGASACLNTFGDVTTNHVQADGLSWTHDGDFAPQPSRVRLLNSQWSNSDGTIDHAKVLMLHNHFDESHMHVSRALPFSRFVENEWNAPWNDTVPCLHLAQSENRALLRENHWRGGKGLQGSESAFRALCNVWELCDEAVILQGTTDGCFDSSCGAGGNVWTSNDVHIALKKAPLPVLSNSNNQFGHAYEWIARGLTTSNASQWNIYGANWDNVLPAATTPSGSNLNTNVQRWTDSGYLDVPWHAANNIEAMTCAEYQQSKPSKKKSATRDLTNVLGQQIQPQSDSIDGLNPLPRKNE